MKMVLVRISLKEEHAAVCVLSTGLWFIRRNAAPALGQGPSMIEQVLGIGIPLRLGLIMQWFFSGLARLWECVCKHSCSKQPPKV